MSCELKDVMLMLIDLIKRKGITQNMGENLLLVSEEVLYMCKYLDSVRALQEEHVIDILTGLTMRGYAHL